MGDSQFLKSQARKVIRQILEKMYLLGFFCVQRLLNKTPEDLKITLEMLTVN
jgi:hypothetical protein